METVSALVVVQDEEFSCFNSIDSIAKLVDEVIVFEAGSFDRTEVEVRKAVSCNGNVLLVDKSKLSCTASLAEIRNYLADQASSDWMLWWDSDFLVSDALFNDTKPTENLIRLAKEESRDFNQILFAGANIGPVIGKDILKRPMHGSSGDTQMTRKGFMGFEVGEYVDTRFYRQDRRCRYLNYTGSSFFYHLDIKNPLRMAIRAFIHEFKRLRTLAEYSGTFGDFLLDKVGSNDKDIILGRYLSSLREKVIDFDWNRFGTLPILLNSLGKDQPFSVETGGEIRLSAAGHESVNRYRWEDLLRS
jgi:hypothetical protein